MPLRYVGIRVRDLERSLTFYTKALGLREVHRGDLSTYGLGTWVLLQDPKTKQRLELNWYPRTSRFAGPYDPGDGLDHIGFLLGSVGERVLRQEYRRLLAAGARPTEITPDASGGWVANVRDPDGNWIEIFRRPTPAEVREARRKAAQERRRARARSSSSA